MVTSKRPLVLWSGGFDSTCLVINKLLQSDIDILYVNLDNNSFQQRHEKRAIRKLKSIIADANLPGKIVEEHTFRYQTIKISRESIFAQPPLWLLAATFIANPEFHSSVSIGYVKYDDAWHYKYEIFKAYEALVNLTFNSNKVLLDFPFEWKTKKDLIDMLKVDFTYADQILKLAYHCESGNVKSCGECSSCKRHKSELSI